MFEDINFANHMYTKISDIKLNNSIPNNELDNKIKYNDNNFNRIMEDTKNTKNTNLDYLYYEETDNKVIKKNKNKDNLEKKKNKTIRLYILLFISFYFLNSYVVINAINSYKIQYHLSLIIRSFLFLILYYLIKRFV